MKAESGFTGGVLLLGVSIVIPEGIVEVCSSGKEDGEHEEASVYIYH